MKKQKMILIAIIGLVVFGSAIYAVIQSQNGGNKAVSKSVSVGDVKRMSLEASIFTTGRVLAADERSVYAEAQAGKVEKILVKEGQSVAMGAVLATLSTTDLNDQIHSAQIQLSIAKESLKQLQTSGKVNFDLALKTAEQAVTDAAKAVNEKTTLYASGAISLAEKTAAESALTRAKTELEASKRNYNNYGKESQIRIQALSVQAAETTLAQLTKSRDKAVIKSPMAGVVYKVNVKVGDPVSMAVPMFNLSSDKRLEVECNVSEFDIDQVSIGQEAIIKGDGFEDVYKGRISYISPVAESVMNGQASETVVKIKIAIDEAQTKFKPNFSASVEIQTAAVENALTLPYESIYTTKEGVKKVFVVSTDKLAEKVIKTGVEGDLVIEVIGDAVKEGDQVVLNPTEEFKDGDTVKVLKSAGGQK